MGVDALRRQVAVTSVRGAWSPASASVHLTVDHAAERSVFKDGPTPVEAWAYDQAGEAVGTLLLWVSDGHLSDLELGWVTDEPPTFLPSADNVRVRC